ncbi:THAP domain-containing protein [Phthorimaea operculella]|nr:THAP domain-containing protein [Phthorimaea operculella]
MPYCVVKSCKNNSSQSSTGISFHKFPKDPVVRDQWTQIIRQTKKNDNWTPSDFCVVCSEHFEGVDLYCAKTGLHRLRKDAIPTKNIFSNRLGPNVLSVKIENDSSDPEDDEPLQPAKQNFETTSNKQANRKLCWQYRDITLAKVLGSRPEKEKTRLPASI